MLNQLSRFLDPLSNKIQSMIALGVVKLIYKSDQAQRLQIAMLEGELRDQVKHHLPYGFTQHPHPGAEGITLFMGGDKTEGLTILVGDERYHLQVEQGEVALYDDQKQVVHLTRNGIKIETSKRIDMKASDMTVDVPLVKFTGDIQVGDVKFLPHYHDNIEPGSGNSGMPSS